VKDVLKDNVWNILVLVVSLIGMYFTVQSNTKEIESLNEKIIELEANKVSNSVMRLKEQFLASELTAIDDRISHIDERLTKKIKLQNEMEADLSCLVTEVAVHEQQIKQAESELDGLWVFTNKFLEKL
jgi:hypothetical protein